MPLVRLTYPRAAVTAAQKRQLAASLTEIVLDAKVDVIRPQVRPCPKAPPAS